MARVPVDAPALDNRRVASAYVAGPYGLIELLESERTTGILPISLIGMPGSGKSTVGKEVARRLGLAFADCDKAIENRAGCSIAALFDREGEDVFRDLESQVLASLVAQGPSVIATGGGVVLRSGNRELLRTRTHCVYLLASLGLLWKRVRRDRRRPLLQVADPRQRLRELSSEREPLYQETAHLVVDTEGMSFDCLVGETIGRLRSERLR